MNQDYVSDTFMPALAELRDKVAQLEQDNEKQLRIRNGISPERFNKGEIARVLFVAQHPSIWPSWRSVHSAMNRNSCVDVTVVICPFVHGAASQMVTLERMRQCLIDEDITFVTADYLNLETLKPHVAFLQNPYDETRPEALRADALMKMGVRIAYIPYGLEVGGGAWNIRAQFDLPFQRSAWLIFARSDRHKRMYGMYSAAGNSNVVVTGHPKFDKRSEKLPTISQDIKDKAGNRKVVLWTPHFSVTDTPSWSTYRIYGEYILQSFQAQNDLFLLIRPHPLFFKSMLANNVWTDKGEDEFRKSIQANENIGLDESSDYFSAFEMSDALMTDVGSFLLEYLPTGKPLLYLHHPKGLGMNDEESLTVSLYRADSKNDIQNYIDMLKSNEDPKKNLREEVVGKYLSGLGEDIGQCICNAMLERMAKGSHIRLYNPSGHDNLLKQAAEWPQSDKLESMWANSHDKQALALRAVLSNLPSVESAIDMGCGDGELTFLIAQKARYVEAFDNSDETTNSARLKSIEKGIVNISFVNSGLEGINPLQRFDLLTCINVLRYSIHDSEILPILYKFRNLVHPESHVIIIDTVAALSEIKISSLSAAHARIRFVEDIRWAFRQSGFSIVTETVIEKLDDNIASKLFLLKPIPSY